MPTIIKQDGFRIVIYPNDHLPSHVHVIKGDGEVRISLNTVRLIDSIVRIAPCLVAIICAYWSGDPSSGEPRPYRAAKSPNSGGLLSILLPQNWGLGGLSEPYWDITR